MEPKTQPERNTSPRADRLLSYILRSGLFLSMAVVAFGGLIFLWNYGNETIDYRLFKGEPNALTSLPAILHDILYDHGLGIMQLGIVLMIATPVSRVAACFVLFACKRDYMYVIIAAIVLMALLFGMFGQKLISNLGTFFS